MILEISLILLSLDVSDFEVKQCKAMLILNVRVKLVYEYMYLISQ